MAEAWCGHSFTSFPRRASVRVQAARRTLGATDPGRKLGVELTRASHGDQSRVLSRAEGR